ncbi:hypothetical protein F4804DRAFT_58484 [Jackrogersella minutella]|nr:hypothetical protein F4804DRAFT_58484 [Jackrogersella minutella]
MSHNSDQQGDPSGSFGSSQKPPRRLACQRCNRQKLQCRWEDESDQVCIRCHRANAVCTSSTPRRIGRPTQGQSRDAQGAASAHNQDQSQQQQQQQQQQEQELQNIENFPGLGSPSCDAAAHAPNMNAPSSSFTQWSLHTPTQRIEDIWQFTGGRFGSPSSNTVTNNVSLLATPIDARMGHGGPFDGAPIQPSHARQDRLSDYQDTNNHQLPIVTQDDWTQRLWSLQLLLNQQLNQIQSVARSDAINVESRGRRHVKAPFPIDIVLTSVQTFIDMLLRFKPATSIRINRGDTNDDLSSFGGGSTAVPATLESGGSPAGSLLGNGEGQFLSPSPPPTANPFAELDTPTICIMVSCYARLIDIYDEVFQYLRRSLQFDMGRQSAPRPDLPLFQLGNFQLRDNIILQITIIVRIFLHSMLCVEKSMGIFGKHSIVGEGGAGSIDIAQSSISQDEEVDGWSKVLNVILALEANGPGGHMRSMESLRHNIKSVREQLEGASF